MNIATLGGGSGHIVLDTGGTDRIEMNGPVTGISDGPLLLRATSTGAAAMTIPAGTLMTTPTDGALEADANALYFTTDAGNRGNIPVKQMIRADATRTYTSNASAQNIFNAPTNGRLTIETGTYRFQSTLIFQAMSATSGNRNINIVGGGSATCSAFVWQTWGFDGTVSTVGAGGSAINIATGSTSSAVPAAIGTSMVVSMDGSFECTVAGTIQPQTTMVTAAASTLTIGSYMEFWRVGSTSLVSTGQWD